jgi:hypothetical protein
VTLTSTFMAFVGEDRLDPLQLSSLLAAVALMVLSPTTAPPLLLLSPLPPTTTTTAPPPLPPPLLSLLERFRASGDMFREGDKKFRHDYIDVVVLLWRCSFWRYSFWRYPHTLSPTLYSTVTTPLATREK